VFVELYLVVVMPVAVVISILGRLLHNGRLGGERVIPVQGQGFGGDAVTG
jgi:hypothetical protein